MKKNNEITFDCQYHTLQEVIDFFQKMGIKPKDVKLDLDFSDCYYEGDSPSVKAYSEKINKK
jgi:hypothetical protein